jgi:hypothetical protein
MGNRSELLARQFEAANREFISTVEAVSDEDWTNVCPAETWTVGVTAHHVAYGYPMLIEVQDALVAGESRPITMQMIDELNADHAKQYADCSKEETVRLLREDGERAARSIRSLPDDALDTRHHLPLLGDEPVPLERFINALFIGHHAAHLPSIRDAVPSASRAMAR